MKSSENFGLNPRQARLAHLVAMGLSARKAAAQAGMSERHAQVIVHRPAFRQFVTHIQEMIIRRSIGQLVRASTKAARKLVALTDSKDESIALRASTTILDSLIRLNEHADLAARVAELESLAPPSGPGGRAA